LTYPAFHAHTASLVRKHLTPERYQRLKNLKTPSGFALDDAICSGLIHPDSSVGIYAGDKDSYTLFSDVFTPIIQDYHGLGQTLPRHVQKMTPQAFVPLDPEGRFIKSVRIRVARSLAGIPFSNHMTRAQRLEVETKAMDAAATLPPDLSGRYIRFSDLTQAQLDALVADKLAFPKGDRFQEAAGMNRDFPVGRGVFLSSDNCFRIWVNEEDHLRIMAVETGADFGQVLQGFVTGLAHMEASLDLCFDPGIGFVNACPTNLGTAMRAGVHIHLPGLAKIKNQLKEIVSAHHLQIRGTMGENTAVEEAVFDISNARRLGVCADTILADLHRGLDAIIQAEKNLTQH
jgi:creatine kinase/arginine kinase